jgi:hypothetical protein
VAKVYGVHHVKVDDCSFFLKDLKQKMFFNNNQGNSSNKKSAKPLEENLQFDINEVFKVEG